MVGQVIQKRRSRKYRPLDWITRISGEYLQITRHNGPQRPLLEAENCGLGGAAGRK